MKNFLLVVSLFAILLTGCEKKSINTSGDDIKSRENVVFTQNNITESGENVQKPTTTTLYSFKSEYESKNDKISKNGSNYRFVSIPEDNPYVKVSPSEVLDLLDNKETFYLFFGDSLCPWCRAVIEKSIEVAKNKGIDKIYYLKIWDENGDEVLRDKYKLENNELVLEKEGKEEYYKLLDAFENFLDDYEFDGVSGEKISTGEKRIYVPAFIYVKDGIAKKYTEGISDTKIDINGPLSGDILAEEEQIFNSFFDN